MLAAVSAIAISSCGGAGGGKSSTDTENGMADFVTVRDGEFRLGDSTYRFIGTNFWYGPILASEGRGGDRQRLARELDFLQELGVTNLRVLAGADGAEGLASHVEPTLQTAPGVYNDTLLRGLDYFLADLEKRGMKAVVYLNNAWEWSGGFSTYLEWAGAGKAVNPADAGYPAYMAYASNFVRNDSARALAAKHVENIVTRVNTVTGKPYTESPAIMAWQIANEPRPFAEESMRPFAEWIGETARRSRSLTETILCRSAARVPGDVRTPLNCGMKSMRFRKWIMPPYIYGPTTGVGCVRKTSPTAWRKPSPTQTHI